MGGFNLIKIPLWRCPIHAIDNDSIFSSTGLFNRRSDFISDSVYATPQTVWPHLSEKGMYKL